MNEKLESISDSEKLNFSADSNTGNQGVWFLGRFICFNKELKRSIIFLKRSEKKINHLLKFFALLVVFGGWLAYGTWLYLNKETFLANPLDILFFWRDTSALISIFLFSLFFDLFLVYKNSEKHAAKKKIDYRLFNSKKKKKYSKTYDVSMAFSDEAYSIIEDSFLLVNKLKQKEVEVIHLFRVLLKTKKVQNLFIRLDVDGKKLVELIDRHLTKDQSNSTDSIEFNKNLQELLVKAFIDAYSRGLESIDILNLILFCADSDKVLEEILYELEVDQDKIKNTVEWFRVNDKLIKSYNHYHSLAILKPGNNMNRAYTAIATPVLDHFSHDLTVEAKFGNLDICIGRQKEFKAIFDAFSGGHNGLLLVGPTGVGKTTLVNGLAQLMVEENVPDFLKDKRLIEIDVSRLVSGVSPSEAEERLLNCLSEASRSGNIIIYLDNIENLIGISSGSKESLDVSDVLANAINRRNIYCLAAATVDNYNRYIENFSLGDSLTTIAVNEPSINDTIQILETKVAFLESKYDIYVVYNALEQAAKMADKYLHDKFLPLKAINLLEKAAAISSQASKNNPDAYFCSKDEVGVAISELTGVPVSKVTVNESQRLLNLESEIHSRLIGQEEAVSAVCASLRRARVQMKEDKRPIASFLFLGPTGVGKTELAKAVSQVYFGDENYLVRLDMSEYQNPDSVKKMIGDPDGTLGYLTEAVRKKPFALILLDEIEKAHPDILNLFLQLLDDGRLTDGQGRTIIFTESIIIATSNIGALYIQEQIKANTPINIIKQELVDNQLNKYMRPELVNRFDGIIAFKPLTEEDVCKVAALMLKKIKKNLLDKGISLKADKDGVAILAKEGYDPKFGARPLRRLLQDKIENKIANYILSGEIKRRDTVIINAKAEVEVEKAEEL
jgi:ATP-dependent Clp protease ATP-binding subunit ClpC